MTDRPILFSGPMVRAILEGRKTQTRRELKPQPDWISSSGRWRWPLPKRACFKGCCTEVVSASREWHEYAPKEAFPFQVGDRLYVREAWGTAHRGDATPHGNPYDPQTLYRATDIEPSGLEAEVQWEPFKWRPSIHMPRWASRLTLTVTDVRVQRLQDISEEDAADEGIIIEVIPDSNTTTVRFGEHGRDYATEAFRDLWDSINAQRNGGAYAWDANPWVVAITFDVHKVNIDKMAEAA